MICFPVCLLTNCLGHELGSEFLNGVNVLNGEGITKREQLKEEGNQNVKGEL